MDEELDPETAENIKRIAQGMAIANIVTHVALAQGSDMCDRLFLETVDQMFQIYREASNTKLRNEDKAVS